MIEVDKLYKILFRLGIVEEIELEDGVYYDVWFELDEDDK